MNETTKQVNDGGPAFPHIIKSWANDNISQPHAGMSLRDYFAGQAMAFWADTKVGGWVGDFPKHTADQIARHCYLMADAMLLARESK